MLEDIHPGESLLKELIKPRGIAARQLALSVGVPPSLVKNIVNAIRPVSACTALWLGLFFSIDARFRLNLQTEYDVRVARRDLLAKIAPRVRVFQAA